MRRTAKDSDGYDPSGRRGDAYMAAREAGWSVQQIAGKFGVIESAVSAAVSNISVRTNNAPMFPRKSARPGGIIRPTRGATGAYKWNSSPRQTRFGPRV
jgi:hypothetical protein